MKARDPFFGKRYFAAIPGDSYGAGVVNGTWFDTYLKGDILSVVAEVNTIGGGGSVIFSAEHADDDGAGVPDAGTIADIDEAFVVLPKHTPSDPDAEPTVGSYPATVVAATDDLAPLRFYIDPQYSMDADPSGATGLKRWVRINATVAVSAKLSAFGETCNPHPGI